MATSLHPYWAFSPRDGGTGPTLQGWAATSAKREKAWPPGNGQGTSVPSPGQAPRASDEPLQGGRSARRQGFCSTDSNPGSQREVTVSSRRASERRDGGRGRSEQVMRSDGAGITCHPKKSECGHCPHPTPEFMRPCRELSAMRVKKPRTALKAPGQGPNPPAHDRPHSLAPAPEAAHVAAGPGQKPLDRSAGLTWPGQGDSGFPEETGGSARWAGSPGGQEAGGGTPPRAGGRQDSCTCALERPQGGAALQGAVPNLGPAGAGPPEGPQVREEADESRSKTSQGQLPQGVRAGSRGSCFKLERAKSRSGK